MRSVPLSCTFLLLLLMMLVLHFQTLHFLVKLLRIQQPRALWAYARCMLFCIGHLPCAVFDWARTWYAVFHCTPTMLSLLSPKGSKIK
jgi:hypothetical protein